MSQENANKRSRISFALLAELLGIPARHFSPSWILAFRTLGEKGTFLIILLTAQAEKGHFHILTKRIICWPWLGLKALIHLDSGVWAGVLLNDLPCRCWIPWTVLKIPCREAANPWTGQQTGMGCGVST